MTRYPRVAKDSAGVYTVLRDPVDEQEGNGQTITRADRYANKSDLFKGVFREQGGFPKGIATGTDIWSASAGARSSAKLNSQTLRAIFRQAAAVRAAVDSVVRSISTLPWVVLPKKIDFNNLKEATLARAAFATEFLWNPNVNPENFQQLLSKVLTDLLVLDAGAIEKVFSFFDKGKLLELYARDGASIKPVEDRHGVLLYYEQQNTMRGVNKKIRFERDELVYLKMYPQTNSVYGLPMIDSIVNEIGALLFAIDYIGTSFDIDEIAPGILHLGNIGHDAYLRAKAEFTHFKGLKGQNRIHVIDNVDAVKWIEMRKPNREQQVFEIIGLIELIIFRNFGIQPTSMGITRSVNKSSAQVMQRLEDSKLTVPIIKLLQYNINTEIVPAFGDDITFMFLPTTAPTSDESEASSKRVFSGISTINQERLRAGELPIPGGDRPFIQIGKRMFFVDELEKAVSEGLADNTGAEANQIEGDAGDESD